MFNTNRNIKIKDNFYKNLKKLEKILCMSYSPEIFGRFRKKCYLSQSLQWYDF